MTLVETVEPDRAEPSAEAGCPAPAVDGEQEVPLALRLEREIRAGRVELPVLPKVALEVQDLIDREADTTSIVRALEREPSVAASLIRYAHAAVFAGLPDVKDLQQAVMRLGRGAVRNTVVSLSAKGAFGGRTGPYKEIYQTIWLHSITTAIAARRLAGHGGVSGEVAFLGGLIHDIGKVVVLRGIETLRTKDPKGFVIDDHNITDFMDALHCTVGDILCETWRIPAELRDAVRRHHQEDLTVPGDCLTAVVQMANLMATKIGASLRPDETLRLVDRPAASLLRLDDVKIASILVDLEDERERILAII